MHLIFLHHRKVETRPTYRKCLVNFRHRVTFLPYNYSSITPIAPGTRCQWLPYIHSLGNLPTIRLPVCNIVMSQVWDSSSIITVVTREIVTRSIRQVTNVSATGNLFLYLVYRQGVISAYRCEYKMLPTFLIRKMKSCVLQLYSISW